jgi:hypothetical protein
MLFFIITLSAYCTLECVGLIDRNVKPLNYYWDKTEVTTDGKLQDWIDCGGSRDGNYAASVSDFYQIQRCMLQKGYLYTGKCDNEIMKATPSCGVP